MPGGADPFRAQFLLQVRAEGEGEVDRLTQALTRARANAEQVRQEFVASEKDADEYKAAIAGLSGTISFLEKRLDALVAPMMRQAEASEKATTAAREMSDKINAAFDRDAAAAERAAEREIAARAKVAAADDTEMARALGTHAAFWNQVATQEEASAARTQEIHDKVAQVRRGEMADGDFHARMIAGVNREQDHYNQLLEEGLVVEQTAIRSKKALTQAEAEYLSHVVSAQAAFDGTTKLMGPLTSQLNQGAMASNKFGYGVLNVAHAIQDAQYGFGAVLNNIPLVVQAFGGGAGLAGTIMVAGVAFELLKNHMGDVKTALGLTLSPMQAMANSAKDLEAKLKALSDKPFKTRMDYSDIEMATEALRRHKEALAAFEAGKKTKAERDLGVQAQEVVDAAGGSGALSAVVQGAALAGGRTFGKQSDVDQEKELTALIAADKASKVGANAVATALIDFHIKTLEGKREQVRNAIQQANIDFAVQEVGLFAKGDPGAIQRMKGLAERQPQAFQPEALAGLMGMAGSPEEIQAKQRARLQHDLAEKEAKEEAAKKKVLQDAADRGADQVRQQRAQNISQFAASFGGDKQLGGLFEDRAREEVAGGIKTVGGLQAKLLPEAMQKLRAGGVPEDMSDEVAKAILQKVIFKVMGGLVAAGGRGKAPDIQAAAVADIAAENAKEQAKGERKEEALGRKQEALGRRQMKAQGQGQMAAFAGQLQEEFQGNISDEQAMAGARHFQQAVAHGENTAVALRGALAMMTGFFRQNLMAQGAINGTLGEMQGMLAAAAAQQQMLLGEAQMMKGRVGKQRVQRAFPMATLPF